MRSITKIIFSISLYLSRFLSMVFSLFTNIYLAKTLSVENFGIYSISLSLIYVFLIVSEWGQNLSGTRLIASLQNEIEKTNVVSEILSFKIIISLITAIAYFLVIYLFYPDYQLVLSISLIQILIAPFILDWYFQGEEQFSFISARQVLTSITGFGLVYFLVNRFDQTQLSIIIYNSSIAFNILLIFFIFVKQSKSIRLSITRLKFLERIKSSGLYFFSLITITFSYSLGLILLGILNMAVEAAIYSTYYRIFSSLVAPAIITYNIFLPKLVKENTLLNNGKYLFILVNGALIIIYGATLFGSDIYKYLYHTKYTFDPLIFFFFLILIFIHFVNYYYLYVLLAKRLDFYFFICSFISLVVNLALVTYLYATSNLSAVSVTLSLLVAEVVNLILGIIFLYKTKHCRNFSIVFAGLLLFATISSMTHFIQEQLFNGNTVVVIAGCFFAYSLLILLSYRYLCRQN